MRIEMDDGQVRVALSQGPEDWVCDRVISANRDGLFALSNGAMYSLLDCGKSNFIPQLQIATVRERSWRAHINTHLAPHVRRVAVHGLPDLRRSTCRSAHERRVRVEGNPYQSWHVLCSEHSSRCGAGGSTSENVRTGIAVVRCTVCEILLTQISFNLVRIAIWAVTEYL